MIIASYFNKGGVGKTTLAIHLAGVLSESQLEEILVIDCVDQGDSFQFFTGRKPKRRKELETGKSDVSVIYNPDLEKTTNISSIRQYDHIIMDLNSPIHKASEMINESHIQKVFLPVNYQWQSLSNLRGSIELLRFSREELGYRLNATIVPLGRQKSEIREKLKNLSDVPDQLEISDKIGMHPSYFNKVFKNRKYVWEVSEDCSYVFDILDRNIYI